MRQFQRSERVWRKAVRRPTAGGRAGDPGQMLPVVVSAISPRTGSADTSVGRVAKPASALPTTPCTGTAAPSRPYSRVTDTALSVGK